jgi:hypothetical protein
MINWPLVPFRVGGLLAAAFFALFAFTAFRILWHGWYSKPGSQGKASFCTFRAYLIQGTVTLIVAALLFYFSIRHY